MTNDPGQVASEDDLPEQMKVRREKRDTLLAEGAKPYPLGIKPSTSLAALRAKYGDLEAGAETGTEVTVAGRIIFVRNTGKLCFATIREGEGTELQLMLSLAKVGDDALADWKRLVDIGDIVAATGEVVTSRRGELSVMATTWTMAAKALRPLPVAHKSLNEETRVRQRYVDLIMRPQAQKVARGRSHVMRVLRDVMHERDFMEVETPMLQVLHGGASARPFVTHSNAWDMELYLRIAPELYLKRCVVGGLEKVFEINRNFRNEGADSTHSPEFAMLEAYEAYGDYHSIAELTRTLVQTAATRVFGSTVAEHADGTQVDLGGEWPWLSMFDAISNALGEEVTIDTSYETLVSFADKVDLAIDPLWGPGKLAEELFEHLALDSLNAPTFVCDYPEETSPLTSPHREKPGVTEKWDLYIRGVETATGYSELNDPVIQRKRFMEQARLGARGDKEAMPLDEDFLRAMEYGMPPMGGVGMGVDRLLMGLTGMGIRETILFPLVKPEA